MKKHNIILLLSALIGLCSCNSKYNYYYEELQPQKEKSISDFINNFGEPISEYYEDYVKDSLRGMNWDERFDKKNGELKLPLTKVITRTFFIANKGCENGRQLVVDVTTPVDTPVDLKLLGYKRYDRKDKNYINEEGLYLIFSEGCAPNMDKLEKSRKKIESWLTKWVFKSSYLGKDSARFEFSKDGSYIYSTSMFGGMTSKGTWEIKNGYNIGEATIILTPPAAQVQAGDVPSKIYINAYEKDNMLANGETKYYPIKSSN